jgi:hypothetical protein
LGPLIVRVTELGRPAECPEGIGDAVASTYSDEGTESCARAGSSRRKWTLTSDQVERTLAGHGRTDANAELTTSDGRLVGLVTRHDAEKALRQLDQLS